MNHIIRFGIDLAKNSFALCGVDANGKIQLRKTLNRKQLLEFFSNRPSALIAMEAGPGAHYWARELTRLGHDARIIDPRFVRIKNEQQQAVLMVHRLRTACVASHTRTINQIRGWLAEFGIVVPRGASTLKNQWHRPRIEHADRVPEPAWTTLDALYAQLKKIHLQVLAFERQINQFIREDERARRLTQISGIGPVTASAIVATVGNGHDFKNGRQFAAWLGLTPRQYGLTARAAGPRN